VTTGIGSQITIDGVSMLRPAVLEWHAVHARTLTPSAGRPKVEHWLMGAGLPDVIDRCEWVLSYPLSEEYSVLNDYLEQLRTEADVHLFADWKARKATYTTRSGQQAFWLLRGDAGGLDYPGFEGAAYDIKVSRNGAPLTVTYKPLVEPSDVVPAGHAWVSTTTQRIPEAGFHGARFVIGTPNVLRDRIRVESHGLYRVGLEDLPTSPFERVAFEEKTVYFTEVA